MLKRYITLTFACIAGAAVIAYAGDYGLLQLRIHNGNGNAFGTVTVHRYYAVPQKSGKLEFLSTDPQDQTCVHSLFPHLGNAPCWYLVRHTEQRINL
jgi:hypothetical protein